MTGDRKPPPSGAAASASATARSTLLWIGIAVVTVAAVVGIGMMLDRSGALDPAVADETAVAADDHYLVYLARIEVESRQPDGGSWDVRESGPDIRYEIHWRGNRVFRSSEKEDTLLALWDPAELGLGDLLDGISSTSSVKAARITATPGETIEFRVVDTDVFANDDIGRWVVPVESLTVGEQVWKAPAQGIREAVCRVLRANQGGR